MKITAEFNSNEELASFISTFGAKGFVPEQGVASLKATKKIETVKEAGKPVVETATAGRSTWSRDQGHKCEAGNVEQRHSSTQRYVGPKEASNCAELDN